MTVALEGGEWSAACPDHTLPPGKDPVPSLLEAGWAPGLVCMGGKSRPHRNSIPDCPVRSQLLYWLSYPALIEVSVIICQYATVCCLYFTSQDVSSDQYLQVGSRSQWLIWYVTYHHIWQFLQLIGHLNAIRSKLFLHCRQDMQKALHTSAIVTCQY